MSKLEVINKCAHKLLFLIEKKIWKIWMILDIENKKWDFIHCIHKIQLFRTHHLLNFTTEIILKVNVVISFLVANYLFERALLHTKKCVQFCNWMDWNNHWNKVPSFRKCQSESSSLHFDRFKWDWKAIQAIQAIQYFKKYCKHFTYIPMYSFFWRVKKIIHF